MVPFVQVFLLEDLGCTKTFVGVLMVVNGVANIIFTWFWGYLSDKFGRKPFVNICAAYVIITPLVWIFVNPGNYMVLLLLLYFISGIFWAGLNINIFTLLMGLVPDEGKSKYFAGFYITVGLSGAVAPVIGGILMELVGSVNLGLFVLTNFQLILVLAFLLRCGAYVLLLKVREPEEVSTGYVLKQFRMTNPFKVFINLFLFSSNVSQPKKVAIIKRLGETGSPLVVDELLTSLDDASHEVREEAIRALGKVKHGKAVEPLIERLDDHSSEIRSLAARALGDIQDSRSVPPLMKKLDSPDGKMRSEAADALGNIGDLAAFPKIIERLKADKDPQVVVSTAGALGKLGRLSAIWEILPILRRTDNPTIRQELATAIGNLLGRHGEFYELLQEDQQFAGSGCSRMLEAFFRSVSRIVESRSTTLADREKITECIMQALNQQDHSEVARQANVVCQRVIFQFLCRVSEEQRWPRESWRDVVYAGYLKQLEGLSTVDHRLVNNAWYVLHMAQDEKNGCAEETLLVFYALRNVGERVRELYMRKE
jgi:hypothetical protein